MSAQFDEVSKAWASKKLDDAHIRHTGIRNVDFAVQHSGGCYGHTEDEYCYCETNVSTRVTIFYFNGSKRCDYQSVEYDEYCLGDLIKELVEW